VAERSEADKVLAGMEMVSWGYKPAFWESECVPQIEKELSRGRAYSPTFLGFATLLIGGLAGGYALLFGAGGALAMSLAAGATLVVGAGMMRGFVRWRRIRLADVNIATVEPRVLFTSNGVLFGPVARLWKGDGYCLIHVGAERSGTTIRLVFTPSFGPITTLDVPVPTEFEDELPELVRMIELRTPKGKAAARERDISPQPPR